MTISQFKLLTIFYDTFIERLKQFILQLVIK